MEKGNVRAILLLMIVVDIWLKRCCCEYTYILISNGAMTIVQCSTVHHKTESARPHHLFQQVLHEQCEVLRAFGAGARAVGVHVRHL